MTERKENNGRLSSGASVNSLNKFTKRFIPNSDNGEGKRILDQYQKTWFLTDRNHLPLVNKVVTSGLPKETAERVFNGLAPTLFEQAAAEMVEDSFFRLGLRLNVGRRPVLFDPQSFAIWEEWGRRSGFLRPPEGKMAAYREWPYDVFMPIWLNFDRLPPTSPGWPIQEEVLIYPDNIVEPQIIAGGYLRAAILYGLLARHFEEKPYLGVRTETAWIKANDRMMSFVAWQAVEPGACQLEDVSKVVGNWQVEPEVLINSTVQAYSHWIRREIHNNRLNGAGREWGKQEAGKRFSPYITNLERVTGGIHPVVKENIWLKVVEVFGD